MSKYFADNGTEITDDMVDRWAQEAEDGFPGCSLEPFEGRAWEAQTQPLKPRTIRLTDTMWHLIEADARNRHMSVSAWTRQALANELAGMH